MSAINAMPIWYPPQFPLQVRLPKSEAQVRDNLYRRSKAERDHHDSLCVAAGRRVSKPCSKSLHITLCFDGTGNNLNNDLFESGDQPHPTNIARIFRASIGAGHTGGVSHRAESSRLTDAFANGDNEYFKYYMPGVGTPFPEVGDLDYGLPGLAFAKYGEERINWGLLMILDALRRALGLPRQGHKTLAAAIEAMSTRHVFELATGKANRLRQFVTQFWPLRDALRTAMTPNPGQCQLLGLQLYVYGFSRGAAAARAFVFRLNELLSHQGESLCFNIGGLKLPISVEYLGILDTVASVGVADLVPVYSGHMSWADGTQQLPDNGLVKRCLHIVASHEQRLCFPLDSIRREDGTYPANSVEVLHPGVHSDQGGGYPPGDQGKALSSDSRVGDGLLLSQIALNDLYADAFAHGAPLKVPADSLPEELKRDLWRALPREVTLEFTVAHPLVHRFNAWREVTLGLRAAIEPLPTELADQYKPIQSDQPLEQALRNQMAWMTAWRIDRYAFMTLKKQPFYKQATDTHGEPTARKKAEIDRDQRQAEVKKENRSQLYAQTRSGQPARPFKPGVKDFDPDMAQTQLREAAEEFGDAYRAANLERPAAVLAAREQNALNNIEGGSTEKKTDAVLAWEAQLRMKAAGQALVSRLFPPPAGEINHFHEHFQGLVDESRNASQAEGLLRALFDDQVHDSRAWFLYWSTYRLPPKTRREPLGNYLFDRIVYFGERNSRWWVAYDRNGQPLASRSPGLQEPATQAPVMDAERLAQAQDNIDALFNSSGVADASV